MNCSKCSSTNLKSKKVVSWVLIIFGGIGLLSLDLEVIPGGIMFIILGIAIMKLNFFNKFFCKDCKKRKQQEKDRKKNNSRNSTYVPVNAILSVRIENERPQKSSQTIKAEHLNYTKVKKLTTDFTVLDFETSGLSPIHDKIIQVAAVKYRNFEKVDEFVCYVNPGIKISNKITEITGITNADLKEAKTIEEVLPKLNEFITGETLVAHNAPFDMKFLLSKKNECGLDYEKYRVICTLSLARKYIDFTRDHKLVTLKSMLRLNHFNSHDALHDCYVTAELYKYCYEQNLVNV